MNVWMNECMNEWTNERTNERSNERTIKRTNEPQTYEQTNEQVNKLYNLYPALETRGPSPGCILRRSLMFRSFGKDVGNYSTSRWVRMAYSCTSHRRWLAASHSGPYMAYEVHIVTGVWFKWGEHMRWPFVYCLCLAHRLSFWTRAPVTTDHSQLAKDIDQYSMFQLCGRPWPPKAGTHFNDWIK